LISHGPWVFLTVLHRRNHWYVKVMSLLLLIHLIGWMHLPTLSAPIQLVLVSLHTLLAYPKVYLLHKYKSKKIKYTVHLSTKNHTLRTWIRHIVDDDTNNTILSPRRNIEMSIIQPGCCFLQRLQYHKTIKQHPVFLFGSHIPRKYICIVGIETTPALAARSGKSSVQTSTAEICSVNK
jgi:hypothetical protein